MPVAGQKLDFKFPWHDCMQPIAADFLAVERAAVECAYAGCKTIWIVCHDDMQPLIRHRLGEFLGDPQSLRRASFGKYPEIHKKYIPIFYVPIHPKDRKKRDCFSWSVLYGATVATDISALMSKWTKPDKFYVAFPYGVYPVRALIDCMKSISKERNFFFSYQGKTVADNEYLGFTFTPEDLEVFIKNLRIEGTGRYVPYSDPSTFRDGVYPTEMLSPEERWSARFFDLKDVFKYDKIEAENKQELEWYCNISSWDGFRSYLGSEKALLIKRPSKHVMSYHELNPIGGEFEQD